MAIRTGAFDHNFPEILLHTRVRLALFSVASIVPINPGNDPIKTDFPTEMASFNRSSAFRLQDRKFFAVCAVIEDINHLLRKVCERNVQVEPVVSSETIHRSPIPPIGIVVKRLVDERPVGDTPTLVRNQEVRMHLQIGAESGTGYTRPRRFIKGKVMRSQLSHQDTMLRASEIL